MPGLSKIKVSREGFEAATKTQLRDVLRESLRPVGDLWHREFKPIKFTDAATKRYNLVPRAGEPGSNRKWKGSYTYRKAARATSGGSFGSRAIGETKPFVWSGRTRALALGNSKVEVAALSHGEGRCDVIINAPQLNISPKGGRINMREEMERVALVEEKQLSSLFGRTYGGKLARLRAKKTRTIG